MRQKDIRIKTADAEAVGYHFEGYASTYGNTDLDGDVVEKGAFRETLAQKSVVPMCYNHDRDKVIGKLELTDADKGVLAKGTLNLDDPLAKNIYALLQMGALDAMSIGMYVEDYDPIDKSRPFGGWNIKKANIVETSVVTVPANDAARVETVKSLSDKEREELATLRMEKKRQRVDSILEKMEEKINEFRGTT